LGKTLPFSPPYFLPPKKSHKIKFDPSHQKTYRHRLEGLKPLIGGEKNMFQRWSLFLACGFGITTPFPAWEVDVATDFCLFHKGPSDMLHSMQGVYYTSCNLGRFSTPTKFSMES